MQDTGSKDQSSPSFARRLDRLLGDMNAVLAVVALGLAILDFTCFVTLRAADTLPAVQLQSEMQVAPPAGAAPAARR
jgi:hypothetical protein